MKQPLAYVFSGVRPSSGAATLDNVAPIEMSDTLEPAEIAAAEDGRNPSNTYPDACYFNSPFNDCSSGRHSVSLQPTAELQFPHHAGKAENLRVLVILRFLDHRL